MEIHRKDYQNSFLVLLKRPLLGKFAAHLGTANKTLNSIIFCYCQGNGTWLSDKVVTFIDSNPIDLIVMGLL